MDPAEIEFLAEKENIKIVPNFTHGVMHLIQGDVGPFKPGLPVSVPLWLAVNLRQRQRCRLVRPDWMAVDRLEEVRDQEKEETVFTEMPASNIFVISNLILDVATVDIEKADEVRTVLKDIWDIRQAKLRKSVHQFIQGGFLTAQLNHLQLIELNTVRPLLPHAFDQIDRLNLATAGARRSTQASNSSRSFLSNSLSY